MHKCLKSIATAYLLFLGLPVWTIRGMLTWATFVYHAEEMR
jgi:hypothetical protein